MIHGCICHECGYYHSHIFPDPRNKKKFICVNCKKKILEKRNLNEVKEDGRNI